MTGAPRGYGEDRRRDLRRIALLQGVDAAGTIETGCQRFVLAAVHDLERTSSCQDIQTRIRDLYGMRLQLEEISWACVALVQQGKLIESDQYRSLSDEGRKEVLDRIRASKEVETAAFEQWEWAIASKFPQLGTEQLAGLREDLASWLPRVVGIYNVETGVLCDPDHERHERYANEARLLSQTILPERDAFVTMIRADALMKFFEKPQKVQLRYLENLIASAYLMAVFTLDPEMLGDVQKIINGQRLYLDTNMLYSLSTLNGIEKYLLARRILNFARRLGYLVCVTPWTVREMEESVRAARARSMRQRPSQRPAADMSHENDTDEKFASAFRRAQRDQALTEKAFFELHEDVPRLLDKEHVEVVDELCEEIDGEEELIDGEIARLELVPGGQEKHRQLQRHDVKLKLLVEGIRGGRRRRFSDMRALVLTNDHTLMLFAEQDEDRAGDLPFAVSLKQWARIMRRLVPRTEDFDGSLAQMQEAPELRASEFVGQKEIVAAIEQIREKEMLEPKRIVRILVDSFGGDDDVEEKAAGVPGQDGEAVFSLMTRVLELEAEIGELHRQALKEHREMDVEREKLLRSIVRLKAELQGATRQAREALVELKRARNRAPSGVADRHVEAELTAVEAKLKVLEGRVQKNEFRVRWGGGAMFALGGIACGTLPLFVGGFESGWPLRGAVVAGVLMVLGAVGWVFDRRRAGALATAIGLMLGIPASLQTLTGGEGSRPVPPTTQVVGGNKHDHGRRAADEVRPRSRARPHP